MTTTPRTAPVTHRKPDATPIPMILWICIGIAGAALAAMFSMQPAALIAGSVTLILINWLSDKLLP